MVRVKITSHDNETYEAWRERDHDDLVLSMGMAAWVAECIPKPLTDAQVANLVLSGSGLSGKDLGAGESAASVAMCRR